MMIINSERWLFQIPTVGILVSLRYYYSFCNFVEFLSLLLLLLVSICSDSFSFYFRFSFSYFRGSRGLMDSESDL